MSYIHDIRRKDDAAKRRFVVVATSISFLIILGVWIPIRISQWQSGSVQKKTQVANLKPEESVLPTTAPAVAGDSAIRIFTNIASSSPKPVESVLSTPIATVMPSSSPEGGELFVPTISPNLVTPTPMVTDFPTL